MTKNGPLRMVSMLCRQCISEDHVLIFPAAYAQLASLGRIHITNCQRVLIYFGHGQTKDRPLKAGSNQQITVGNPSAVGNKFT